MLPNEQQVQQSIQQNLSADMDVASTLLAFGVSLPASKDLHQGSFPSDSVVTAVGLFIKASITFRAIIHLCELGLDRSAMPLTRSLFETFANLSFLLRRRISLYRFNEVPVNGRTETRQTPLPLHGKTLTPEFRTALYNAWCILRDDHMVDQWAKTPGLERLGKSFHKKLQSAARPYVDVIGKEWEKSIRSSNTCVGLSIADFAASLGPAFRKWHRVVYSGDSKSVHQSDLTSYLDADPTGQALCPRWHTSDEEVREVLKKAATIYLGCVEEMNNRFRFGSEAKQRIGEYGNQLRQWD